MLSNYTSLVINLSGTQGAVRHTSKQGSKLLFLLDKHICCLQRASEQHSDFLHWSPKPRATCLALNTLETENHPHVAKLLLGEHSVRSVGMIKAWVKHSQLSYENTTSRFWIMKTYVMQDFFIKCHSWSSYHLKHNKACLRLNWTVKFQ